MAADTYPCDGVDMLSHLTLGDLGLSFANDMWGWTDPLTSRDYALIGGIEGMVVVDISDPKRPDIIGTLPTQTTTGGDFWRDIKVYANHAFVVSENSGHGMQVFDLTEVRGVTGDPVVFAPTAVYTNGIGNAHNVAINEDTGYAYVVGSSTCSGGLHMVDISDPTDPQGAGCFSAHGYIHDTQCVIYEGPDTEHNGSEVCFNAVAPNSNPNSVHAISIVDVSDKGNPAVLALLPYPNQGYSHQGWLTPDQQYFLHNDELDEVARGLNTTTRIFDVRDLDAPTLVNAVEHETTSIGHNAYTEGRYAFASNYTSGLRVFDITSVGLGEMPEAAFFDVYPADDDATFNGGTWSNYPYFHQKKVVAVSSMDGGLFVLRPRIGS
jgi:choice-of-anchor B domain-containing protein